ncbi:MAG: hypothetical protein HY553_07375 [Elusimicrobia bacterium]|nr:hypothetical protein [Elusimicrobiota bacterium]
MEPKAFADPRLLRDAALVAAVLAAGLAGAVFAAGRPEPPAPPPTGAAFFPPRTESTEHAIACCVGLRACELEQP